ncbi:EAL domain-containing protein [Rhizobiaceae bacterium BDR2-2]|uniref:EAL domain-containing protein n=1 Tax=Ectorhizobium quercum TaxID=2965071 RepID=A0AAE3SUE1_9HYPH|nr:EAL domain-containing protein [Ectorhizobium quercum]MCX8996578.1 EAL domain-containing protein [Ectorhizobium quercum]
MTSSVENRFLVIISGALLIVVAPLFALFLVLSSEQIAKTQAQHLTALVTGSGQALTKPLWDFDVEAIGQVVDSLVSDPLVKRVNVRDTAGLFDIVRDAPGIESDDRLESMTRPIHYKSLNGSKHVGWLEIYFTPVDLFSAFDSFNIMLCGIFLLAILLVCGAAVVGNRMMISRPLLRLSAAIEATRTNGSRHHVDWSSNDEIGRLAASFNDMQTALEREERELKWAHEHTTEIYNSTPAMLFSTDAAERITAVSDYWLLATGYERRAVIGRRFVSFLHENDQSFYSSRFGSTVLDGEPRDITTRFICADGHVMDVLIASAVLPATHSRPAASLSVMTDVTELRQSEQRNRRQAITDHLTGLLNRQGFEQALSHGIVAAEAAGTELSCLFIDLDRFKAVNDRLGHATGDAVLRQFVERLQTVLTRGEIAARLGGDEFSVVTSGPDAGEHGRTLAAHIVSLFDVPFLADGQEIRLSASIGLAHYPHQAVSAGELLQHADMAMYSRKHAGKNGAHVFDPSMLDDTLRRSEIETHIEQALKNDWFEVHFQPIHGLCGGGVRGFEALLRLRHPEKGLLPPADIIQVAEETGSIGRIGSVVLEKAVGQLARLSALDGLHDTYVAVNFSAMQFDPGLAARIAATISHHGLHPGRLVVEITEAVLMEDDPQIRMTLEEIARFGCRIALDDFGTGYSSLSYLNRFPVNIVKIDQSFIRASTDPSPEIAAKSRLLIEGIAMISHKMNCQVVAEGIETKSQLAILLEAGADYGQGYYFHEPMSLADLLNQFAAQPGTEAATG